ncbi:MAG: hypothetical protein ACOVJ6_07340 [Pirellulales bacterium]
MNLQVEPAALLELFEAAAWYDDARDGLGAEFIAAIEYASITVVAIAHGRRRPLYWIDRIRSST